MRPDSRSFRQLMGCFTTGVAVATVAHPDGGPVGITVNSLTSVSLDPPMVLFCLDKQAHVFPAFRRATHFAVNLLAADQQEVSRSFADRTVPEPKGIWAIAKQGVPLLKGTMGWALCRKAATYKGGDHVILLGEVIELSRRAGVTAPLTYFQGHYRQLAD